ncbi:SusC/RagA family TonB-linked outer membrane protein [Hymenobacter segetis]|uniref:SusC/RagA family TonB-linked outer membrane protein n=1 Tax=Hymenobacter segetis TaxID=2025509 RepID=A0ABU9LW38_9BACT
MKHFFFMVVLLMTCLLQQVNAQDRTISGRVTDRSNGQGLPGATVLVKGTTIGASTNADGSFSLSVPANATALSISSVGFASIEQPIGANTTFNVSLAADTKQLGEVVVTALGVERTRNSLPFSATQIEGNNITVARNPNAVNGLAGKVAGLNIQQNNGLGSSSNVVIRGTKSLFGNNQALFVVDGVPISNANTNTATQATGGGGYDYGNAAADINPDDIASTTVLKGAAATALYGSRAANGVILITTKKGRRGLGVTINAGATLGRIDKSTFIKYQDRYGAGYGRYYEDPTGYFLLRDVQGNGKEELVAPLSEDASYGGAFNPSLLVYQWDSFDPTSPNYRKATPWVNAANGAATFFETASTLNNSVTIDGGNDNGYFKLGYNRVDDRGVMPNSKIAKNIINFAGSLNLTPRLTTSASINYTNVKGQGRYGTGYGDGNIITNMRQWWQTNVDIKDQKAAYERNIGRGYHATWNYADPDNLSPIYWNNPYWVREQNYETDSRDRYFGNVAATYKFTNWFNVLGRVTLDTYSEVQEERLAVGSVGVSEYSRFNRTSREANFDLIGNFSANIASNLTFKGLVGANMRRNAVSSIRAFTNNGLSVPGLYSLSNSVDPLTPPIESETKIGVDGIFGSGTFGFRDMVFLDLTLRRDKSTTLPSANNVFYYPSAALSFAFSELTKESAPWLSYGKALVNYAEVGSDAPSQVVYDYYSKPTAFGSTALFSLPNIKNSDKLVPERTKSIEAGVELAFLNSRLGVNATVYQQNTINQIIPLNLSTATGYSQRYVNSGEIRNRGVEIGGYLTPIKNENVTWTVNLNWYKNQNQVISLAEGLDNIVLASYQGGVTSNATVGQPFGMLRGSDYRYSASGDRILNVTKSASTGLPTAAYYAQTGANNVIGNPNPDWKGGVSNTVSYKGLSLYFLVDIRKGGDVFSLDRYYGLATGLQPETATNNELGNPSRTPITRNSDGTYAATSGGVILPGVYANGTTIGGQDVSGQKNTVRSPNTEYGLYGYLRNPNSTFVYDASFVKLREVSLTYSLPNTLISKMGGVKGIDISLIGRNLWIIHKNLPDADPEDALSSGNLGQGYSSGSFPAVRSMGANLRFRF